MALIDLCIKYFQPFTKFGDSILALFKLKSENESLKAESVVRRNETELLKERLEKSEATRTKLEGELSLKKHKELLKEQKVINQLNEENERNQNIY